MVETQQRKTVEKQRKAVERAAIDLQKKAEKAEPIKIVRCCRDCGIQLPQAKSGQRLCAPCSGAAHARTRAACRQSASYKAAKKAYKTRRRIREDRVFDLIDPARVFARHGWLCQICGISCPEDLKGTTRHNAPELDHIVPLSRGGTHTHDNVQLACRSCNGFKSNKLPEELEMALAA
jgi:5-methylcytosine-specific restriction endonuclease McrA